MKLEDSFLLKINVWSCLFRQDINSNTSVRKPFPVSFKFVYAEPYLTIYNINTRTNQLITLTESLLPKFISETEIKLENEHHKVEIKEHTFYKIEHLKLIFKGTDDVIIFH